MTSFDAETLAQQLAQLGRDLDEEVLNLGKLEEAAVDAEREFRKAEFTYDDSIDKAFLANDGSVEVRKAQARVDCGVDKVVMVGESLEWSRAKAKVRVQNANLSAIRTRIDIGRSLLARERSLLSLGGIGET